MSYKYALYEATKRFLLSWGIPAKEVIGLDDGIEWSGGCETCSYEEIVVNIRYVNVMDKVETYTYYGTFGEFIARLDEVMDEN